jgi:hypothetical protein
MSVKPFKGGEWDGTRPAEINQSNDAVFGNINELKIKKIFSFSKINLFALTLILLTWRIW